MKQEAVRLSLVLYDYPAHEIVPIAQAAEAAGFDALWAGEHYVSPQAFTSEHPSANPEDEHPAARIVGPHVRIHDPWSVLSAVAGATARLNVGTAISIVPLNHPLLLARSALTLQQISGGRLFLGTGAGWLREEFDILGVPFRTRASRYDEMLDIMRKAWAGGYFAHSGSHFEFPAVQLTPHAVHVPVLIGGNSDVALRRVARTGDGWVNSAMIDLDDALRMRTRIEALRVESDTQHKPFRYIVRPRQAARDEVGRFVEAGFSNIMLWGPQVWPNDSDAPLTEKRGMLERVAEELLS